LSLKFQRKSSFYSDFSASFLKNPLNIMNDSFVSTNQNTEIDSINSYFECITECSIVDGHQECITRCLEVHLKGGDQNE